MKSEPYYNQRDYQDRQTIALSLEQGLSMRAIGRVLNRSAATISREIARNSLGRPSPKLVADNPLFESITELLRLRWSPQQIAAHLAKLHPSDSVQRASHETIHNVIYAQPRGELRKELIARLRMARTKRWPRSKGEDRRGHMADMLSIHVRPPGVEDRQFPGHWEGDLIKGAVNQSAVGTLVEPNTRLLILVKLPHPNPATAAHVL